MKGMLRWRACLPGVALDPALRDWLREPGSLTARLQRQGTFQLQLLRQCRGRAHADEFSAVGVPARGRCWLREVLLHRDGRPVIFAHTVLPAAPRGVLCRWLARLGGRSLGSLLFAHPGFRRGALSYARIDAHHPLHARAAAALGVQVPYFLARRCVHRFGRQSVLVTEVFSPAIAAP